MEGSGNTPIGPGMRKVLEEGMDPARGCMSLEAFIHRALYHPREGYYLGPGSRVGHRRGTDFYTAASLGGVFSRLVMAAMEHMAGTSLESFSLVEFGPESAAGIMGHIGDSPFKETLQVRPGDDFQIPPRAIVFSNELFDAQPFRRFIRRSGNWLEAGVRFAGEGLASCEMEPVAPLPALPEAPEGYIIDWPGQAIDLLRKICTPQWDGLFIAFDYGLEKATVFNERPDGTGRTYAAHRLGNDLLANPGQTDITCHVIWDDLEAALRECGFGTVQVQRQESFFMHHSTAAIAEILKDDPGGFSKEKQTLKELLHPDNMGAKFQVLSGRRGEV